jgi:uncharacterized protein YbjT (DUF2867 family)
MKIIVFGGSGFIGSALCEKLAAAGHSITVPTRRLANARHLQSLPRLEPVEVDVFNPQQLANVLAGHDVAVNLIAVLHGDAARFERIHVQLPRSLAAACVAAGVPRMVHVSALGAALDAPSLYLRSKAQGEAALVASGLQVCMLRPSVVFGAGDKLLNTFASIQQLAPIVPLAGADAQFQPVWLQDVAQALLLLTTDVSYQKSSYLRNKDVDYQGKTLQNTVYEACGPQVMALRDLFAIAGRCVGALRPVLPLPSAVAQLQAWVMEHLPGEPLMSRDNLASMQVPNIASGQHPGLLDLGITPASVHAIAPTYLGTHSPLDGYRSQHTT